MNILYLGIAVFLGAHLFTLLAKPARAGLVASLGEGPWKLAFTAVSLIGLGLMIWGLAAVRSGSEPVVMLYEPPTWGRHAAMLLVLLAFLSLAISLHKGRLKLALKHPMSIAFGLWAIGHLLANGSQAEVLFFGAFLLLAVLDIVVSTARGHVASFIPKPRHDVISIGAGVLMYLVFLYLLHPLLIGVAVV
jgi:uncharacterized membrane protein